MLLNVMVYMTLNSKGIGDELMNAQIEEIKKDIEICKDKMMVLANYAMPHQYDEEKAKEYYEVQRKFNELRKELNRLLDMRKRCCMCKKMVTEYVTDVVGEIYCTSCQQEYLHKCDHCNQYAYEDPVEVLVPNGIDENGNPLVNIEYWCEDCAEKKSW